MNCDQVKKLICEYIGGCLPDPLHRRVKAHLDNCPACEDEAKNVTDMVSCLRSLSCRSPVDCWPEIRKRLLAQQSGHPAPWRFASLWSRSSVTRTIRRPIIAAPAFAVALLLAVFLLWLSPVSEPPQRGPARSPEYSELIAAHSSAQRQQAFNDPDVVFVSAELARAGAVADSNPDR